MTMKTKIFVVIGALFCVAAVMVEKQFRLPEAKLTVRVLGEDHVPIANAQVSFTFQDPLTTRGLPMEGLTDSKGEFSGQGGSDSTIAGRISKEGYYRSGFPFKPFRETDKISNRWLPWNETHIAILRKIGNPVPMYAKDAWVDIPAIAEPCGYDLGVGDWVAPYGKGARSDLVFRLKRDYDNRSKFSVSVDLGFSNEGDGIQLVELPEEGKYSEFKWPRLAPESGYELTLNAHYGAIPGSGYQGNVNEEQAYFFRVRTVKQNGRIVSALYGKIKGGFELAPSNSKTCKVHLTYYLNPTPLDRSMEWDPKQNLVKGLSRDETPRAP
jgi:hypothetical protein